MCVIDRIIFAILARNYCENFRDVYFYSQPELYISFVILSSGNIFRTIFFLGRVKAVTHLFSVSRLERKGRTHTQLCVTQFAEFLSLGHFVTICSLCYCKSSIVFNIPRLNFLSKTSRRMCNGTSKCNANILF